ncbi:unnamed protein product [Staurois parvus]|uniref:Uncharacterized protein n=1 Tax=Staurois parvus TaxID=386267 RepID=A0ABN9DAB0_9NEOB|nr:unnamed protein product [Staurois parvus]
MDFSQFPGRKNSKNAGRAQDKALGTKCVLLCKICLEKMKFFKIF